MTRTVRRGGPRDPAKTGDPARDRINAHLAAYAAPAWHAELVRHLIGDHGTDPAAFPMKRTAIKAAHAAAHDPHAGPLTAPRGGE